MNTGPQYETKKDAIYQNLVLVLLHNHKSIYNLILISLKNIAGMKALNKL